MIICIILFEGSGIYITEECIIMYTDLITSSKFSLILSFPINLTPAGCILYFACPIVKPRHLSHLEYRIYMWKNL